MHQDNAVRKLQAMGATPAHLNSLTGAVAKLQARGLSLDKILKLIRMLPQLWEMLRKAGVLGDESPDMPPAPAAKKK